MCVFNREMSCMEGNTRSTFKYPGKLNSLVGQMVKRLSTKQETQVRSLSREHPLEKEMETHSSTIAWKIPWMEEPSGLHSPWGRKELDTTEQLHFHLYSQGPEQKSRVHSPVFPDGEGDSCEFTCCNQSFC